MAFVKARVRKLLRTLVCTLLHCYLIFLQSSIMTMISTRTSSTGPRTLQWFFGLTLIAIAAATFYMPDFVSPQKISSDTKEVRFSDEGSNSASVVASNQMRPFRWRIFSLREDLWTYPHGQNSRNRNQWRTSSSF